VLLYILEEIRHLIRKDLPKPEKFRLKGEDMREDKELSLTVARNLTAQLIQSIEDAKNPPTMPKAEEARLNCELNLK